ncbi:MAG TPA: tyrosine--tRNA ligase [Atribacteraceae bacterium]|nr:tyrosine--tRNA ligase [Atribacteraceae bacterium]
MDVRSQAARDVSLLSRGVDEMITPEDLERKIVRGYEEDLPLIVKEGFDPSAPDIHLGHTVSLRKLKQFQDLGHQVVFLIGDFTGRIGDPTGKNEIRKQLTEEEVIENARTYAEQINVILDPVRTIVEFNSKWLKHLTLVDMIEIMGRFTVARIIEREDFSQRLKAGKPVGLHEFLYPMMQAYDSVALRSDVELGGSDQRFNLLVGREMQRHFGQDAQVVITMPLLEGTDGVEKMSKSLGNYIGISEPPFEMFHKVMVIPDSLVEKYFLLLTEIPEDKIATRQRACRDGALHPRQWKKELAWEIVRMYHGSAAASQADVDFEKAFVLEETPQGARDIIVRETDLANDRIWILKLLRMTGIPSSNSEARRLVEQGGVSLDNQRISDSQAEVALADGGLLRVGKRNFFRIVRA